MWATNIVGWGLTRKAKAQHVSMLQKFSMSVLGITFIFSLFMIALDGAGLVQTNIAFFQSVMASIVGAAVGYLFGSNARVQSSDG